MEPLTVQMTDEQIKRKQEQQKAKAPPPGASRILTRANREQKKQETKHASPVRNQAVKPAEASKAVTDPSKQPNGVASEQTNHKTAATKQADDAEEWQNYVEDLNPGLSPTPFPL